jgi:gas vesicle protein
MSHRNNGLTMLSVGLGTGALIALMFAPESGKEMRKTLRRRFEAARDAVEDLGDQASNWIDRGSELANKAKSTVAPLRKAFER